MAKRRLIGIAAIGALSQVMPQTAPIATSAAFVQANHLAVSMVAAASCTTITASALAFPGTVSPGSSVQSLTASGSVTFNCSANTSPVLGFDAGLHPTTATPGLANLRGGLGGTQSIAYSLYSDAAGTSPLAPVVGTTATALGNITGGSTLTPTGGANTFAVYAIAPTVGAQIAPGTYTDTITATLYF